MQITTANLTAVSGHACRIKNYIMIASGAVQAAGGALMVAAPHLQTVLTPTGFALVMIGTGAVTAALAFVTTQLKIDPLT